MNIEKTATYKLILSEKEARYLNKALRLLEDILEESNNIIEDFSIDTETFEELKEVCHCGIIDLPDF